MGNAQSIPKINFEDVQVACKNPEIYLLINTLPVYEQSCLIYNSVSALQEEAIINKHLKINKNVAILVYGKIQAMKLPIKNINNLYSWGFPMYICIWVGCLNGSYFKMYMVLLIFRQRHLS